MNNCQPSQSKVIYLKAKRILWLSRPRPGPNKPVSGRNLTKDIKHQRDSIVCNVLGVGGSGVCDCDATAAALRKVDMVNAGAGSHHEMKGRKEVKKVSVDRGGAHSDESVYGRGVAGEEILRRLIGGRGDVVEKAEGGLHAVRERENEPGETVQQHERPAVVIFFVPTWDMEVFFGRHFGFREQCDCVTQKK